MTPYRCSSCNKKAEDSNLDLKNMLLYCTTCESFQKLTPVDSINSIKGTLKATVSKPKHIEINRLNGSTVMMMKQTFTPFLSLIPVVFILGIFFYMARLPMTEAALIFFGVIIVFGFLLANKHPKWKIEITKNSLTSSKKSFYQRSFLTQLSVPIEVIIQLFVVARKISNGENKSITFDLITKLDCGSSQVLIKGHSNPKDLYFIEQFIEAQLDIEDSIDKAEAPNVSSLIPSISGIFNMIKNR